MTREEEFKKMYLGVFQPDTSFEALFKLVRNRPSKDNAKELYNLIQVLDAKDKRIAELRKEVERYKKLNADYIWFTRDEVKGLDENQTGIIDLAKLKLEMQAKGIEDAVNCLDRPDVPMAPAFIMNDDLRDYVNQLRQQAKELK